MPIGHQRGDDELELAPPPDDRAVEALDEGVHWPGTGQSYFRTPRMLVPARIAS